MRPDSEFRLALPDTEYLHQLGRTQYVVQSGEGLIVEIIQSLDPGVDLVMLADLTMHNLAEQLTSKINGAAGSYTQQQIDQLHEVAARWAALPPMRNNVAHSRPATHPSGAQRLYRWAPNKNAFLFIDTEVLDDLEQRAEAILLDLDGCRAWLLPRVC